MSVDKVIEQRIVPTGRAVGRCRTGAVAAGCVTAQAATVVGGEVGLRTGGHAAAIFDVVDAVAIALVWTGLPARPALRMTRRTRLFHIHCVPLQAAHELRCSADIWGNYPERRVRECPSTLRENCLGWVTGSACRITSLYLQRL